MIALGPYLQTAPGRSPAYGVQPLWHCSGSQIPYRSLDLTYTPADLRQSCQNAQWATSCLGVPEDA